MFGFAVVPTPQPDLDLGEPRPFSWLTSSVRPRQVWPVEDETGEYYVFTATLTSIGSEQCMGLDVKAGVTE